MFLRTGLTTLLIQGLLAERVVAAPSSVPQSDTPVGFLFVSSQHQTL